MPPEETRPARDTEVPLVSIIVRSMERPRAHGFVVETEDEVRRCIARLANDARLRRDVGLAARETAWSAMRAQCERAQAFYFGARTPPNS